MTTNPIKPTIGRNVLFVHPSGATYAAFISAVHSAECVDLHVCVPSVEQPIALWSSILYSESIDGSSLGTWHWMPYQIGQAAKTQAIERDLRAEQEARRALAPGESPL